jgi:transposase
VVVPWSAKPDVIVSHRPSQCACGHTLSSRLGEEKEARQVRDVQVIITTTEHRVLETSCPKCRQKSRGEFPREASARSVWGDSVKAFSLLLTQRALLPTQASADVLEALGLDVAPGCLDLWRRDLAATLTREFIPALRTALLEEPFLCFDETPLNVKAGAGYTHVATNGSLTAYHLGTRALEATLAGEVFGPFTGVAVHDNYASYYSKSLPPKLHQTCVAHLVRDLKLVVENFQPTDEREHPRPWAAEMLALLGAAMQERPALTSTRSEYRRILRRALAGPVPERRGTIESDAHNLAIRLRDYEESVLRFLTKDARAIGLPPTNNAAEQAVRPIKVRERRSGCFRTEAGAKEFLAVQSYVRSAVNSGIEPISALEAALSGVPWSPLDS